MLRDDIEESYETFLPRLAQASGITVPNRVGVVWSDRKRKAAAREAMYPNCRGFEAHAGNGCCGNVADGSNVPTRSSMKPDRCVAC